MYENDVGAVENAYFWSQPKLKIGFGGISKAYRKFQEIPRQFNAQKVGSPHPEITSIFQFWSLEFNSEYNFGLGPRMGGSKVYNIDVYKSYVE